MQLAESRLPTPRYVEFSGTNVATYVLEPERSMGDVVFCHGTPWSAQVWADVAYRLGSNYRVFLWDMPGYGHSIGPADTPLDLPTQMSRFSELLAHWELERPHVVAHDIGGAVALGAHLLHDNDFAALFLWDVVTLAPWGSPFFRLVADHSEVFAQLPGPLHAALVQEYISAAAHHRLDSEWLDRLCQPWLGESGQRAFYRQIASLRPEHTEPVADRLPRTRCGVEIGWGTDDPWLPFAQATRLRDQLPGDQSVVRIEGAGHLTPIETPIHVGDELEEWLTRTGIALTTDNREHSPKN
ncbi:putative hydrolase [Gordonia effusa NBRC 100432]|uniref:Putative hydrolase n=1 Tax=Gordonia effusa NBRC 100432 TaxID=1077974 RepID=H0R441_9ACTN|nr:alpha/beta hydrolase [Gordonia effusa]GAB19842.1 putative hydrolase [Gordonia effusa NBRC 100432]